MIPEMKDLKDIQPLELPMGDRGNPDLTTGRVGWVQPPHGTPRERQEGNLLPLTRIEPGGTIRQMDPDHPRNGATRSSDVKTQIQGPIKAISGQPDVPYQRPSGAGELQREPGATRVS